MTGNNNCKNLKITCSKMKSKCSLKLANVFGSSKNARKCKTALGNQKNAKVNTYCKKTCNKCGKQNINIQTN